MKPWHTRPASLSVRRLLRLARSLYMRAAADPDNKYINRLYIKAWGECHRRGIADRIRLDKEN